ncbi:MAG: thioredoxin family protein [Pontixanthobacter sp.]
MTAIRRSAQRFAVWCVLFLIAACAPALHAQPVGSSAPNLKATMLVEGAARPGGEVMAALSFSPVSEAWHGYWKNPGDAGYGMEIEWNLPDGWTAGEPQYPAPKQLVLGGLMNHIYEGPYAVLVPLSVPENARVGSSVSIGATARWLACTDKICVPESGKFALDVQVGQSGALDPRFGQWRAAIPPEIDRGGRYQISRQALQIAIPLPAGLELRDPHVFLANKSLGGGLQPSYAAQQSFDYTGDQLAVEIPLSKLNLGANAEEEFEALSETVSGILSFGDGQAIQFNAQPGKVVASFEHSGSAQASLLLLLLGALAGGLVLNVMPCVFPILSLKALSLARAGGSEQQARHEGIAYTAGVMLACVALGAIMLALRAAGEQVGWAFQLQEPAVVTGLLLLAAMITANFAGIFELPSIPIKRGGQSAGAFATGLLAAVAATPCTGPFMAAAMGASLLLPTGQALLLFAALGLGLGLPFLLLGFDPALRGWLPRPGAWMERFRKLMAIPMGLTALALIWLLSRLAGQNYALVSLIVIAGVLIALFAVGRLQQRGKVAWPAFGLISAPFLIFAAFALPASYSAKLTHSADSILSPQAYSEAGLAATRATGKPVFLWFTADWCVTCKVNESVAIERSATKQAFDKAGVVAMRGDWTRPDPAITAFLNQQGVAGVPLYIWYPAGGEAQILPQVLTQDILVTLSQTPAVVAAAGAAVAESGTGQSTAQGAGSD